MSDKTWRNARWTVPVDTWARISLDDADNQCWSKDAASRVMDGLIAKGAILTTPIVVEGQPEPLGAPVEVDDASEDDGSKHQGPIGWSTWAKDRAGGFADGNTIFSHVQRIFRDICDTAKVIDAELYGRQTTFYEPSSDANTTAEVKLLAPGRRDGQSTCEPERNLSGALAPSDTAVIAQYRLTESTSAMDKKTASGANDLMYNDPRRRFVLALTIEGTSARFWRFDRSTVLVSKRFDCDTHPEYLIRFILYVSFASEIQLGFDPTVTAHWNEKRRFHDFVCNIDGRYFRTSGPPLSEYNKSLIICRGVRVWEVVECDAEGEPFIPEAPRFVMHDLWIWDDALCEKELQDRVLAALQVLDEKDRLEAEKNLPAPLSRVEQMKDLFLTITVCKKVMINGKVDATITKPAEARQIVFGESNATPRAPTSSRNPRQSTQTIPGADEESDEPQHRCRVHWCYVAEELCQTMHEFDNVKAALGVFKDFTVALDLFRQAGFMHRDISSGNCLVYLNPQTGRHQGKLADLEFCKSYEAPSCHDPTTGTYEFMAVESYRREFLFAPIRRFATTVPSQSVPRRPWPRPIYHPHPYHDLESLYWVMVFYILLWYVDTRRPGYRPTPEQYFAWRKEVNWYFNAEELTFSTRKNLIEHIGRLDSLWKEAGWDQNILHVLEPCLALSYTLVSTYQDLQKNPQVDNKYPLSLFTADIYKEFGERLDAAAKVFPPGPAVAMNSFGPNKRTLES